MNSTQPPTARPDEDFITSLITAGLIEDPSSTTFVPLTGGVSSDIWKIETPTREICVKRALKKLKVEADWFVSEDRNRFEVDWYKAANKFAAGAAPRIFHHDETAMWFAMDYLDPNDHVLWKSKLQNGQVSLDDARAVGRLLSQIHSGAAKDADVRARFPSTDIFQEIRLEPYLEATAEKHPDLKDQLMSLSRSTRAQEQTLIHGDVSPKNILIGPKGPVFLDAECACIGDPAFDLAFCLNHFLLKCLWVPTSREDYLQSFAALSETYLAGVDWEPRQQLEKRAAHLLPGLFLARIDGKSPVEYVTENDDKNRVRRCTRDLLLKPVAFLSDVAQAWKTELQK